MDVLSSVMRQLRLNGAVFFSVEANAPVAAHTPNMRDIARIVMPESETVIPFHVMLEGECWVETIDRDQEPVRFRAGDVIVFPQGDAHIFVSNLGDRLPPDLQIYRQAEAAELPVMMRLVHDEAAEIRFVCGYFGCDGGPLNPIVGSLPPRIHVSCPDDGPLIEVDLIGAAVEETAAHRDGGEAILARLSELLFVRVLRWYVEERAEDAAGWFAGLHDPQLRAALALMHAEPGRDWTVAELADNCGMSRAAFAEHFAASIGETPMRYLTQWRMQIAATRLRESQMTVEAVAEHVGYTSQASFTRAFRGLVGAPPSVWRRRQSGAHNPAVRTH